ncbi:hypothetical protein Rcae01_05155 [Novipirellula caenicola]|uniref:Uncharacterized protein n=1 Tax=Novipirellula caenicola TaxID=1536901 RepID=A0ABP9VWY2_9BACT
MIGNDVTASAMPKRFCDVDRLRWSESIGSSALSCSSQVCSQEHLGAKVLGQVDGKGRPHPKLALDFQVTMVFIKNRRRDGQA